MHTGKLCRLFGDDQSLSGHDRSAAQEFAEQKFVRQEFLFYENKKKESDGCYSDLPACNFSHMADSKA